MGRKKVTKQPTTTNMPFYEWVAKRTSSTSTQPLRPTASVAPRTNPTPSTSDSTAATASTQIEQSMEIDPYDDISSVNSDYNVEEALRELDLVQSDEENL